MAQDSGTKSSTRWMMDDVRKTQRESLPVHREEPESVHPLSGVQGLAQDLRMLERWRRVGLGDSEDDDDEADDGSCIAIVLLEVEDAIDGGRWVGWRMEDIRWRVEDVRKDGPTENGHRQRQQPEELELDTTRTLKHMNPSQPIPLVSSKYSSLSLSLSVSHSHSSSLVPRHVIRVVRWEKERKRSSTGASTLAWSSMVVDDLYLETR